MPEADESRFRAWYARHAKEQGLDPDPDAPEHFYDYRAAFRAGASPDETGHWPSEFKQEGHPRMVVDGVNTKTGERVMPGVDLEAVQADPEFQALADDDKKAVLERLGYTGSSGGAGAVMRASTPEDAQSGWDRAKEAIGFALFGDPERREAEEAGIGLQPGAREMITAPLGLAANAAAIAGPVLAGPGIGSAVASGLRAALPAAARAAGVAGLGAGGAAAGGIIGRKLGGYVGFPNAGMVIGTGLGGMLGGNAAAGANRAASRATDAAKAAKAATATKATRAGDIIEAEFREVPKMAPRRLPPASYREAGPATAAPVSSPSVQVTKPPTQDAAFMQRIEAEIVQRKTMNGQSGAQITNHLAETFGIPRKAGNEMVKKVLETHGITKSAPQSNIRIVPKADEATQSLREWAKVNAPKGKFGDKIHLLLENGKPVKVLTSGQAGAATRAGKETTYLANTWGG